MFIFSNLATSLDGKIASADRAHFYLGTPADRRRMQALRKRADAILVGASTLRSFKGPMRVLGSKRQKLNVILSSSLEGISPDWPFFKAEGIQRVLVVTEKTPSARLKKFEPLAKIVVVSSKKPVASQVVRALGKQGVKKLLVEGGGGVMWDFVRERLIDEFHVTLTPWALGGKSAPTLVDGEGFPAKAAQKLKLVRAKRLGNEIYLTYRRV